MSFETPTGCSAAGDAYDRHGAALFRLAHTLCGDTVQAEAAVSSAFHDAFAGRRDVAPGSRPCHDLARLVYLACSPGQPAPCAVALLALTMYGDHTYAEAAALLQVDAQVAAAMLRAALHAG